MQMLHGPVNLLPWVGREPERVANWAGRGRAKRDGEVEKDLTGPAAECIGNALERPEGRLLQPAFHLREVRRAHTGTLCGLSQRESGHLAAGAKCLAEE